MNAETKNAANVRNELTTLPTDSKDAIRAQIAAAIAAGAKITKGKTPDVNSKRTFTFKGVHAGRGHENRAENKINSKINLDDK